MKLKDLFDAAGTDKAAYAPIYEALLRSRRSRIRDLLEIGIGTLIPEAPFSMHGYGADHYRPGGSLRAWRDYFPAARIVGVDVQADTQFKDERISTYICDSTDAAAAGALVARLGGFDVIIDDGSHDADDQLATLANFFPALRQFGLYFIEDIDSRSPLFRNPRLIEPVISGAPFFTVCDGDGKSDMWKLIIIYRMP